MTQLKPQGIVDTINTITVNSIKLKAELVEKKQALQETELYKEIEVLEESIKQLQEQDKEVREKWKNILLDANLKKFEALDGTIIQLNKKPWALVIEDESKIWDDYRKEKTTITIDKKAIKDDLKEWVVIEGVYIKEDYTLAVKNA